MRSGSKWPMIGPRPCVYACVYVDPVFTSESYDIIISTRTRRTNLSVFLVLMLLLPGFRKPTARVTSSRSRKRFKVSG